MAAQRAVAVQGESDVAVRTAPGDAAGPAVERRRDAAPVEEEDRLAASLGELAELGQERCGERIARLAPQIDDAYGRHRRGDAPAELEPFERLPRLRPGRR